MNYFTCVFAFVLLAACSDDSPIGGSNSAGGGGSGGSSGGECDGATCTADEYCGFDEPACDEAGDAHSCHSLPTDCEFAVACGCDGENHVSKCAALSDSGGVSGDGACAPPAGQFICTYEYQVPIYCNLETDYCKVDPSGDVYSRGLPLHRVTMWAGGKPIVRASFDDLDTPLPVLVERLASRDRTW